MHRPEKHLRRPSRVACERHGVQAGASMGALVEQRHPTVLPQWPSHVACERHGLQTGAGASGLVICGAMYPNRLWCIWVFFTPVAFMSLEQATRWVRLFFGNCTFEMLLVHCNSSGQTRLQSNTFSQNKKVHRRTFLNGCCL